MNKASKISAEPPKSKHSIDELLGINKKPSNDVVEKIKDKISDKTSEKMSTRKEQPQILDGEFYLFSSYFTRFIQKCKLVLVIKLNKKL